MGEIIRNRTIRPSTRKESSSYKINTEKVSANDTLIVVITHESLPFKKNYTFEGQHIYPKKSLHFKVQNGKKSPDILWSTVQPL